MAEKSSVCTAAVSTPAFRIFSTSSTKPMLSISSHSSSTRNLSLLRGAVGREGGEPCGGWTERQVGGEWASEEPRA